MKSALTLYQKPAKDITYIKRKLQTDIPHEHRHKISLATKCWQIKFNHMLIICTMTKSDLSQEYRLIQRSKSNECNSLCFQTGKFKKRKEKSMTISIIVEKVLTKIQHPFPIFKISHPSIVIEENFLYPIKNIFEKKSMLTLYVMLKHRKLTCNFRNEVRISALTTSIHLNNRGPNHCNKEKKMEQNIINI